MNRIRFCSTLARRTLRESRSPPWLRRMHRRFPAVPLVIVLTFAALLAGCIRDSGLSASGSNIETPPPVPSAATDAGPATPDAEGFVPLRLSDFEPFPADAASWNESGGVIGTTGKPKGYIHSTKAFQNFTWRGEFRFVPSDGANNDQSNTGFMLCIQEPHKVWPRSLEVQGKHLELGQIKSNGGVPALSISDDPAAREAARLPVGEWNAVEIQCRDGAVAAMLNGRLVCRGEPGELQAGLIGLQSENFAVQFRNLRVREE